MGGKLRTFPVVMGVLLTAVLVGLALFFTLPRSQPVYTDADTIYASKEIASVRDVLWQPPEILSEVLATESDEYEPALSPDGLTLMFVRGRPGENADLYQSVRTTDGWTEPEPVAGLNTESDELGPAFTPDGDGLYFYSDRAGALGGYDIWFVAKTASGWGEPEALGGAVNSPYNDYGPSMSPDGTKLYFASNRPRAPTQDDERESGRWPATVRESFRNLPYDIYAADVTERGMGEAAMVEALSSAFSDGAPEVSPVGDFVYFASNRPGGEGGFDLYRARLVGGEFFPVEHLGDGVNTPFHELDPSLGMGGFGLVFSSDRPEAGREMRDYDLLRTESREVYREAQPLAARMSLVDFLKIAVPWLLLLLLLLGLLTLIRLITTDERWKARWRRLGLLAKCIILSGLLHMLLLALLTLWHVSNDLEGLFNSTGGSKVTLVSSSMGGGAISQIRGEVASSVTIEALDVEVSRAVLEMSSPPVFDAELTGTIPETDVQDAVQAQGVRVMSSMPERAVQEISPESHAEPAMAASVALPLAQRREVVEERPLDAPVPAAHADTPVALNAELGRRSAMSIEAPMPQSEGLVRDELTSESRVEVVHADVRRRAELAELPDLALEARADSAEALALPDAARRTSEPERPVDVSLSVMSPNTPTDAGQSFEARASETPVLVEPDFEVHDEAAFQETALARSASVRTYESEALEPSSADQNAHDFALPIANATERNETQTEEAALDAPDLSSELLTAPGQAELDRVTTVRAEESRLGVVALTLQDETREMLDTFERVTPRRPANSDLDAADLAFDLALPSAVELPEQVAIERHFSGVVVHDTTGEPVAGALVRIDSDQGDLVEVRTDDEGAFVLQPDFESDFVAVTASRPGFLPHAMNLPIAELERGVVREIRLRPLADTVIAIEEEPRVHHLGDNAFGGSINSQFQKESEGLEFSATFTLTGDQIASLGDLAGVSLLAKGLQADNRIRINGEIVRKRMDASPRDGSFGVFRATFDASWLVHGENTISIESRRSSGSDHDDFEFVNVQIHLDPEDDERRPRRSSSQTL